ncbi:hypothetical protein EFY79_11635 [Hanamia caeni]|uniref:Uncharacterized protein n=1 Tax=Hanamia caeni TaxID=2294116 RepID=A0A3M9NDV2_9BACT|nr:hypothetical protein [Hanamia caeni]RNI35615.1 hypothetical protein EFY79_11635 [Hanamia caeni]
MKIDKAILLDKILLKFTGNVTIKWSDLQQGIWDDIASYHVCENNINFLVGQGMLRRNNELQTLCMTDAGFATMTDLVNLGYVTKAKKERRDDFIKYGLACVTVATFIILCFKTFNPNDDKSNLSTPTTIQDSADNQDKVKHGGTVNLAADSVSTKQDTIPTNQNKDFLDTNTLK